MISIIFFSLIYVIIFVIFMYYLSLKYKLKFKLILLVSIIVFYSFPVMNIIPKFLHNIYDVKINNKLYRQFTYDIFSEMNIKIHHNFDALPKNPSILLLNYPNCDFEYFINGILPIDVYYLVSKKAKPLMNLAEIKDKNIIYVKHNKEFDYVLSETEKKIKDRHILCYIESHKKSVSGLGRIKKGMFSIAKKLNIPITPIYIDKINHFYGITKKQTFYVKVGKTQLVNNVFCSKNNVKNFFKNSLKEFAHNQ
jgi:hypothetical protein